MPKNFKEELFFSLIMAGLMVLVMAGYNIALTDGISGGYLLEVLRGYPLALAVALVLDLAIVGPCAKKLFFTYLFKPQMKEKPIFIGLGISVLMVLGMVTLMSVFGLVMAPHHTTSFGAAYLHTWGFNLIMALPLQLLVVGPIARFALAAFQNRGQAVAE